MNRFGGPAAEARVTLSLLGSEKHDRILYIHFYGLVAAIYEIRNKPVATIYKI